MKLRPVGMSQRKGEGRVCLGRGNCKCKEEGRRWLLGRGRNEHKYLVCSHRRPGTDAHPPSPAPS